MTRSTDGVQEDVYYPDGDIEGADWTKQSWDFPPYRSTDFFLAIGGEDKLDDFKESSAYRMAVRRGIILDDEWVLDWVQPVGIGGDGEPAHDATDPHEPGKPRRGKVNVHIHRGK